MKFLKYLSFAALASIMASCSEEPVLPPVYQFTPNTSILELKQAYWQTDGDYVSTVGLTDKNEPIVFKGRVVSSDEAGNVYKSIIVSDGTAAITIAVNKTNTYKSYSYGQEVLVNASYLKIGGFKGLMQLGGETTSGSTSTMTFMASDSLAIHVHQTGQADPAAVKPILTDIAEITNAKATAEGMMLWQSQLVKIEGLTFENPGQEFAPNKQNTNRYLKDANGNRINLRCSGYSSFASSKIPSGTGSVTAILSYYGSDWQLLLNDLNGLEGFDGSDNPGGPDEPTPGPEPGPGEGDGTQDAPYTVGQTIAMGNPGTTAWVKGYIVGVMNYVEGSGNVFSATELTTNTNIVIAATAADYGTSYVAVQLPVGDLRTALNLVDHADNLGKEVAIQGSLEKYCGITGVKASTAAVLDGKPVGTPSEPAGDAKVFTVASEIVSGTAYVLWTDNKVSQPMPSSAYSWLTVASANLEADGSLKTSEANAYTFTKHDQGWTIQDSHGTYLYMQGTYNSFQLGTSLDASNSAYFWNIAPGADGRFEIINASNDKLIQYSSQYNSYGAYTDRTTGTLPYLYKAQ